MFPIGIMKVENTEKLGQLIRTRRKQLGVTQKELAMTCGTGLRFIVDLEKGKPSCQSGKMLQVVQVLGLTLRLDESGGDS
jgi:HTH-type transcriptional regulator/antitoxin HipB